ncbi:DUF3313 family protein [Sphingomonas sp. DT-207]|uniref:DUF3313 family protein n=1 Tax=Sphingomonas sp. DT-207 TaxID=3396167 RepID=UPI003F1B6300
MRTFAKFAAIGLMVAVATPIAAQDARSWDNLLRIKAKKLDAVYLLPHADFRGYTKVMLDPTEVAFRKNWQRDQNSMVDGASRDVSDSDARRIIDEAKQGFDKIFHDAYTKAGYQVVTQPGPDVLRIRTAVLNLDIEAPDTAVGITRSYTHEAGSAMLVVEARDSVSGAVLGRAVDAQETDDFGPYIRNRATNAGEFEQLFSRWAKESTDGLAELKALSPVDPAGRPYKK